jgi:transcriptional regulator with XRE-family HTH domain
MLEFPQRIREFRRRFKFSQHELGERLGVSGNYVSMLELGKKPPGPSLRKLFETIEQSHSHLAAESIPRSNGQTPANQYLTLLSTDTLLRNFGEVAQKLSTGGEPEKQCVVGNLRAILDEIEQRWLTGSSSISEA